MYFWPVKKSLVKSPAVQRQPAEQGIQSLLPAAKTPWHARPNPADPDVNHVRVRLAGAPEKTINAVAPPRGQPVEQRQPHRRAFKGKAAQFQFHPPQFGVQLRAGAAFHGEMVAGQKRAAHALQTVPHRRRSPPETTLLKVHGVAGQAQRAASQCSKCGFQVQWLQFLIQVIQQTSPFPGFCQS